MAHKILNIRYFILFVMLLMLVACSAPEVRTPAPTPHAIHVNYPPALSTWMIKFTTCASSEPLVAIYENQSTDPSIEISSNEIVLALADSNPINPSSYLSQIGWEQIVVVVNEENDLSHLSVDELSSIFSGQIIYWDDTSVQPIDVYVFPDGDPVRNVFDGAVTQSISITSEALLAPDVGAMLEAIAANTNSIGYLPASFLEASDPSLQGKVKIIQLDEPIDEKLRQPVIALTQDEPQGLMRELLVCVQNQGW